MVTSTRWVPGLHPRGHDGRFIEKFGWVSWLMPDGTKKRGQVFSIQDVRGNVVVGVRSDDGEQWIKPERLSQDEAPKASLKMAEAVHGGNPVNLLSKSDWTEILDKPRTWDPKRVRVAEERIKKLLDGGTFEEHPMIDLQGLFAEDAEEVADALTKLHDDFPDTFKRTFAGVVYKHERAPGGAPSSPATAMTTGFAGQVKKNGPIYTGAVITLDEKLWGASWLRPLSHKFPEAGGPMRRDIMHRASVLSGDTVDDSVTGIITHEFGHVIALDVKLQVNPNAWSTQNSQHLDDSIAADVLAEHQTSPQAFLPYPSHYAKSSTEEEFAESFTAYRTGKLGSPNKPWLNEPGGIGKRQQWVKAVLAAAQNPDAATPNSAVLQGKPGKYHLTTPSPDDQHFTVLHDLWHEGSLDDLQSGGSRWGHDGVFFTPNLADWQTGEVYHVTGDFNVYEIADETTGSFNILQGYGDDADFNDLLKKAGNKVGLGDPPYPLPKGQFGVDYYHDLQAELAKELKAQGYDGWWMGGEVVIWNYTKLATPSKQAMLRPDAGDELVPSMPDVRRVKNPAPPRELTDDGLPDVVKKKEAATWAKLTGGATFNDAEENLRAVFEDAISSDPGSVERGRRWYQLEHDDMVTVATNLNMDPETAFAVAAAVSPGLRWPLNRDAATRILEGVRDHPDLEPEALAALLKDEGNWGLPYGWEPLFVACRIAKGANIDEHLTGCKRRSFFNCLLDPSNTMDVTIDSHMLDSAKGGLTPGAAGVFISTSKQKVIDRMYQLDGWVKTQDDNGKTVWLPPADDPNAVAPTLPSGWEAKVPPGADFTAQANLTGLVGSPKYLGHSVGVIPALADIVRGIASDWTAEHPDDPLTPSQVQAIIWEHQIVLHPPEVARTATDAALDATAAFYVGAV